MRYAECFYAREENMAGSRRIAWIAGAALMAACAAEEPGIDVPPPPPTEVREVVDTLHGVEVPDPYRWLEDQEAPETRAWIDAQNAYTDAVLNALPGRDDLRARAAAVLERDAIGLPYERGGRYFYSKRRADQDLAVLYLRDGIDGEERVLIDPHPMSPDHTISVELRDISDDGTRMAYALREGGVDEVSIRVREVDTGEDLTDVLPPARYGQVTLAADGGGLYYERYGDVTPRVMYHAFGTPMADDAQLFGEGYERYQIPVTVISDDGRWMVVHVIEGSSGPTEIHVKDLERDTPFVTAIADGVSESWADFAGGELFIVTNLDAPNKRVVLADPADPGFEKWRAVVPERDDVVVEAAAALGGKLAVSYLQDVQPRVAIHELDGTHVRDIAFDTLGSVGGGAGRWTSDEAFFTFQTFHVPSTIYRYDIATGEQSVWAAPELPVEAAAYQVDQGWFTSKDGTEVPMFVVHRPDVVLDGSNPTLLTGYGGFNNSMTPAFSALATTWLESGGVFALANMRGGGEFGEAWHRAGMLESKQNVFDDFIAAAEWLIAEGYTSAGRIAIQGGSNGGLLVGATLNQRPDLFAAALPAVGVLDMLRYHLPSANARNWSTDYGLSENEDEFRAQYAYSPLHNVQEGACYPPTLVTTADHDDRVVPWHSFKYAAEMQRAQGCDNPVLIRVETRAGHGAGKPTWMQIEDVADQWAFAAWAVGLEPSL
jgi:prolyl oligopeptidase